MQVLVKTQGRRHRRHQGPLDKALGDNPAIKVQDKQDISDEIARHDHTDAEHAVRAAGAWP